MKNIICIPFAYEKEKYSGVNIKNIKKTLIIYQKNFAVSLISAKKNNPNDTVALVTNLDVDMIDSTILKLLEMNNIKILHVEYDSFIFPNKYLWSLAFYKLCALKYLSNSEYDNICYMDTDVYVQDSFKNIWLETKQNILLYDINHGLGIDDYKTIVDEFSSFLNTKNQYLTHFGGEFYASNRENAKTFIKHCEEIYNEMVERNFVTTKGDEFIISIAASSMKTHIKNAGAYIFRYWTGTFRLISTSYKNNSVTVLHIPSEKEKGIIKIFNKYVSNNKLPSNNRAWKLLHLKRMGIETFFKMVIKNFIKE